MPATVYGKLVLRRNRFAAEVEVDGVAALAHVPNSGRMLELMVPGADVVLRCAPEGSLRRTQYDMAAIFYAGCWVGVDARLPPAMVVEAWRTGVLTPLAGYSSVRREVRYGASRIDLLFEGGQGIAYVEAKSVNLVEDGVALFPDAPTLRGAKHLLELREAVRAGHRAAVCFVVQRNDVQVLRPFVAADPAFAATLCRVANEGVEAYAIACEVMPEGCRPVRMVPVEVEG